MVECGDTNTQPNTTYKVTAIVKQSTGNFYHRPAVWGRYVRWTLNNQRGQWFEADVSTGDYQDHMMMRPAGTGRLEVHIGSVHRVLQIAQR
jgi:hypothetical protein